MQSNNKISSMSIDVLSQNDTASDGSVVATPLDLARKFGDIPLSRIHFDPPPGTASEEQCIAINERSDCLCELVDGTLIEKVMGTYESLIAVNLITELNLYLRQNRLGIVLGADGMLRLRVKLIRVPDVSYISKEQLQRGSFPRRGVATMAPTIAVEVISEGNTRREMDEKLTEYFSYGTAEVWYVYPKTQTIDRYTAPQQKETLAADQSLTTPILPGFSCPIAPLFIHPDEDFALIDPS
jgi:Uma2 family endonuclease